MNATRPIPRILILMAPLVACSGSDGPDDSVDQPRAQFYQDVAPILAESCGSCHRDGGAAPFALDSYEAAAAWGPAIETATSARTMPPWNVNNDGSCNEFADARWLSDEQIETIAAWVDDGMAEGDASLGMPATPVVSRLEGDGVITMKSPADYSPIAQAIPGAEFDDYQCFVLDPGLVEDAYLVGYEIEPGNDAIVHHVVGFNVDPARVGLNGQSNADIMAALDAETPNQPGWDCFGGAGDNVWVEGVPMTWAPGTGATLFPGESGVRIAAGQVFVVQIHYNLAEIQDELDQTAVNLKLVDEVEHPAHVALIDGFLISLVNGRAELEPGHEAASYSWSYALNAIPNMTTEFDEVDVWGLLPHMHRRGRSMAIEFDVDGREVCGADVDRWDFDWQQSFYYKQPIPMSMGDVLSATCTWDTRGAEEPILPGFGTADEMCLVGIYLAER